MAHLALTDPKHPDKVKKWLRCLGCGRQMWTDRCHRICAKCNSRNERFGGRRARSLLDVRRLRHQNEELHAHE